jgi:hypothetical protein
VTSVDRLYSCSSSMKKKSVLFPFVFEVDLGVVGVWAI